MPTRWGKSSSKEDKKKGNKESIIDAINRILKISSEEKSNKSSGGSQGPCDVTISDIGSRSRVPLRSPSSSKLVSRCQSFAERPYAQPLPLPEGRRPNLGRSYSGIGDPVKPMFEGESKPLHILPLPRPEHGPKRLHHADIEGDVPVASVSTDISSDSDDPTDSHINSPLTSDYENGNKTAASSPSSFKHKEQSSFFHQNPRETIGAANLSHNYQFPFTSPKLAPLSSNVQNLQISHQGTFCCALDSSMSSPSRSPVRTYGAGQGINCGLLGGRTYSDICLLGSGHCSSPGSGYTSGHNSMVGDFSGQLFWPNSRCSPECSPIPSPRMTSPGPSSRIHSGAVTPQHPRAGGAMMESSTNRLDDGKSQSHRLPLPPPITISNTCPFSPAYSTVTSPSMPRSPNRVENPPSPGARWKKGRLLGRGTCGDVFLGFNNENGEMCAMKEVTLFSDDPKSKESAQQLGQEIMLLSRLRHPNIVRYYGSETVDDKLYIYLEYVSGGSIHKLLQEYGPFGETAIRNYTKQILSGLAYLHSRNTVHRDIKGANILVDPSGRVKVADFGMAKHITGQSCPLSFKGSPYWMAPEVFKNSNGCNLAVDIWSLGCTVLEMATAKPPWSQYEGVAAMFKIGNSKELPAIPDHLSDDGKDFVRKCLQRNPSLRCTAAELLEHPFVKNVAPSERPVWSCDFSEATPAATSTGSSMGIGNGDIVSGVEIEGMAIPQSRGIKIGSESSDFHILNTRSCPVSPTGSPLLRPRSPLQMSGRISPSPITSPTVASGSSTPLTGGTGAIPFHHSKQPMSYMQESTGMIPRSHNSFFTPTGNSNHESRPDAFQRMPQTSLVIQDIISSESSAMGNHFGQTARPDVQKLYRGQLLKDHTILQPSLNVNPSSSMLGRSYGS